MKKYILVLCTFLIISPVFADVFFEPQWNEFCPNKYANLDPEKDYILADKKYWQQRKKEFDQKVKHCKSLVPEQLAACYENLRQIEGNATATHVEELRLKYEESNAAANMWNATNYQVNTTNYMINNAIRNRRY